MTSIPLINVDTFWYPPLFPVPKNLQKSKVRRPSLGPLREGEGDKSLSIGNTESAHRRHLSYLYTIFIVSEYLICNVYDVYMIGPVYMICMHDMYTWFAYSHFDNLSQVKHQYKYTDVYIYIYVLTHSAQVVQLQDVPLEVRPNPQWMYCHTSRCIKWLSGTISHLMFRASQFFFYF